jgi:hypothetical protein
VRRSRPEKVPDLDGEHRQDRFGRDSGGANSYALLAIGEAPCIRGAAVQAGENDEKGNACSEGSLAFGSCSDANFKADHYDFSQ